MSESGLHLLIGVSTAVVAASIAAIAWNCVLISRSVRRFERRAEGLIDELEPLVKDANRAIGEFSDQSGQLLVRLNEISTILQGKVLQVGEVVGEFTDAAQRNISEADKLMAETLRGVGQVTSLIESAVQAPAAKLRALFEGLSAALRYLSRGRSYSPERISTDEEMFI